mmetsp:Transcript_21476/g.26348  ORF Transcript_21476/g.26348 Transcript_21476/m.26348 type:complete len:353 (+) Transcript_21476:97-1155(+)
MQNNTNFSQRWQQMKNFPPYHNGTRNNFPQEGSTGHYFNSFGRGGPTGGPPNNRFYPPRYFSNNGGGGAPSHIKNTDMVTLSPREMCKLQRDCPDAYLLIQQQRLQIHQQRLQLEEAMRDLSKLRNQIKTYEYERADTEDKRQAAHNKEKEFDDKDRENVPPVIDVPPEAKRRSSSPSSQVTESSATYDALPYKKRILESSRMNKKYNKTQRELIKEDEGEKGTKRYKQSLPDLARVALALSNATSPHHSHRGFAKETHAGPSFSFSNSPMNHNQHCHTMENNKSSHPMITSPTYQNEKCYAKEMKGSSLPALATVAATLAAVTSPRFKGFDSTITEKRPGYSEVQQGRFGF